MLRVRAMSPDEVAAMERLARSRTEAARTVERARIIALAHEGKPAPAIARALGVGAGTVRLWLKRFNAHGLDGLADEPRSGCPPTYTPEEVGTVIAAALTAPRSLGLPFGSWTLSRLEAYLNDERGIPIKRSRIDDLLLAEGLRWRTQEGWFGERAGIAAGEDVEMRREGEAVDPAFAQKRGPSSASTRRRRRAASS